jgi:Bacterial dnaA protein helix-turn-helix
LKKERVMQAIYITDVKRAVAARCGVTIAELEGPRRARRYARPRQIAFLLCRELTGASFPVIGLRFGARDHTTVMHGVRAMGELGERNSKYAAMIRDIRATLAGLQMGTREKIAAGAQRPMVEALTDTGREILAAASSAQVTP